MITYKRKRNKTASYGRISIPNPFAIDVNIDCRGAVRWNRCKTMHGINQYKRSIPYSPYCFLPLDVCAFRKQYNRFIFRIALWTLLYTDIQAFYHLVPRVPRVLSEVGVVSLQGKLIVNYCIFSLTNTLISWGPKLFYAVYKDFRMTTLQIVQIVQVNNKCDITVDLHSPLTSIII